MQLATIRRTPLAIYSMMIVLCLLGVVVLDLLTNTLNTTYYQWDFVQYYDMAENGIFNNDHLIAPFAYRFVTPLLAGVIADLSNVSTETGFRVVAYVGAVAQLALVFVLAQAFNPDKKRAGVPVLVVAFSLYNVKFLLFDVSRPDHLAYPLMVVAVLALFRRNIVVCLVASCAGLLVREFLIIPPVILLVELIRDYRASRDQQTLFWIAGIVIATGTFVIVPRALIPVEVSGQYVDPVYRSDWLDKLIEAPLSERRNANLLFNIASYTVPVWLLLTWGRAKRAWLALAGYRLFLVLYMVMVLVLTLYGGTDLWRFMTYLFVPQVMVLAVLLRDEHVSGVEVLYMLAAVAFYNKVWQDIPNLLDPYLDFYGGYDNRLNVETFERCFELAVLGAGMVVLRGLLRLSRYRRGQPR